MLFLQGPVDRYLKLPTGHPAADLLGMARDGLRAKLRLLIREAMNLKQPRTGTAPRVMREGFLRPVHISVEPLVNSPEAEGLLLVTFQDPPQHVDSPERVTGEASRPPLSDAQSQAADDSTLLRQLEEELQLTREQLQDTIAQQEVSSEEMKAANEEVTSVNEELQSTNEELETSKEELQSLNEELTTVNNQLEAKIAELETTSNDLQNLLTSADTATIFLDREMRIKRFTPATTELLRLIPTDVGRPISDVAGNINDKSLMADAGRVLRDLTPIQREVQTLNEPESDPADARSGESNRATHSRHFLRRLLPYRTADDRIEGVVITFTDITTIKQFAQRLAAARDYAESIVQTVREPLLVLDNRLRVCSANRAFYANFETSPDVTHGKLLWELAGGQWNIPKLRTSLEEVLPKNREFCDLEVSRNFSGLGWRRLLLSARAVLGTDGKPELILLAFEDVTDRFQRETAALALREQERVGRELHDSLGQQTTAIGMLAASLHRQLMAESRPEAELAGKLLERIEQAKTEVRMLSQGLLPVELDAEGLMSALAELVEGAGASPELACRFDCESPVTLDDSFAATHLFLIAKEAVHNAVKHAQATQIGVRLTSDEGVLTLEIRDDGIGISAAAAKSDGYGIRIMRYRSDLIGGRFKIESGDTGGTIVSCSVLEQEMRNGRS